MSNLNYINDLFKSLDFPDNLSDYFIPVPYEGSDSCFRYGLDKSGHHSKFIRLVLRQEKVPVKLKYFI